MPDRLDFEKLRITTEIMRIYMWYFGEVLPIQSLSYWRPRRSLIRFCIVAKYHITLDSLCDKLQINSKPWKRHNQHLHFDYFWNLNFNATLRGVGAFQFRLVGSCVLFDCRASISISIARRRSHFFSHFILLLIILSLTNSQWHRWLEKIEIANRRRWSFEVH